MANTNVADYEITMGQKMVSAMSGSLLTSLLGMPLSPIPRMNHC
jgi:hypothetical protein